MKPPVCPYCKKAEWRHVCGTVVHGPKVVVHTLDKVVHAVVHGSRHGKYRDEGRRKAYRRMFMQAERALKAGRAERWPR